MQTPEENMNKDAAADKDEAAANLMRASRSNINGDRVPIIKPAPGTGMVATPANLVMASDPDGCKQLKDMINRDEDATTMVVVLARPADKNEQHSSANKKENLKPPAMDSRLLMVLRTGDEDKLAQLLNGRQTGTAPPHHVSIQMDEDSSYSTAAAGSTGEEGPSYRPAVQGQIQEGKSPPQYQYQPTAQPGKQAGKEERAGTGEEIQAISEPGTQGRHEGGGADNPNCGLLLDGVTLDSEGDSALHVVAASGDSESYLTCAEMIYGRAKNLLVAINKKGDTPVHCAARAGNLDMVKCLIEMAERENNKVELLRKENNTRQTALHGAIHSDNAELIKMLMSEDPELGHIPKDGTSPLYLAISLGLCLEDEGLELFESCRPSIQQSWSGPDGQNILHLAVWRGVFGGKALQDLFKWCPELKKLTGQGDKDGNTPLHFAASMDRWKKSFTSALFLNLVGQHMVYPFWFLRRMPIDGPTTELINATEPPGSSLFQPDNEGSYPIHVAAASGCLKAAMVMLERFPSCATLRDGQGRTFLHVAVDKDMWVIVGYAASRYLEDLEIASVFINMQDNNGNTALHLAIEIGNDLTFRYLFQIPHVRLDIPNEDGLTAIALAWHKIRERGRFYHPLNPRQMIYRALRIARAEGAISRMDQFEETYNSEINEERISDNTTKGSQVMGILAGLVTSVTFAAAFKLPGGYRSGGTDAHGNSNSGETPWLAGRYAFDAFIISIALAFICSLLATIGLIYSGFDSIVFSVRGIYFNRSYRLLQSSARSLAVAFGLGMYLVIQPVSHKIAIAVCIIIFGGLVFQNFEIWRSIILINTIRIRFGLWAALHLYSQSEIPVPLPLYLLVQKFWPLIITFVLPAPWIHWIVPSMIIVLVLLSGYF